jgi:glycosyltransferase involved in cell wall biosynthesis
MSQIEVSVIIPTFNRKESLKKTLESLFNQTYPKDNYEILVCDDKSTDGTENMVKELMKEAPCEFRYFKSKSMYKGPGAARNVGVENARGEIIGFTDDDCVASPTWIEQAVPYFETGGIVAIQGCVPAQVYKANKLEKIFKIKTGLTHTMDTGRYITANMFYRRKAIIEAGCFDPELMRGQDTDLAYRVKRKGYEIPFCENVIVYHAVKYTGYLEYFKRLKYYHEYHALFIRKNPESREKLILRCITSKKKLYPLFILLAIFSYVIGSSMFFNIFIVVAILLYLWARVITDSDIKMYPLRILAFIRYFLIDFISLYYTVKGAVRYKCFVI